MYKICTKCKENKNILEFHKNSYYCKICKAIIAKIYREKNKNIISENKKKYREKHKDKLKIKEKEFYQKNKNLIKLKNKNYRIKNYEKIRLRKKIYREKYKDKIKERKNEYKKNKRANDIAYRLKGQISCLIRHYFKLNKIPKKNSMMNFLPFTFKELKNHIENQFEFWMTWDNQGIYIAKLWNDQDQSTWKWQIDHIIPQSILPYTSMEDENFQKCWALSNLRPYSAKQNCIDGCTKIRHTEDMK